MADDIIKLYENQRIRTAWDEKEQEWYFSVVDVVGILSDQPDYDHARNYWKVLKNRIQKEGNELVTKCNQLKMASPKDGKRYPTDVANTKVLLRIIQSVPSPKAEPFKMWLAQVGAERIEETIDPEQAIDRALKTYQRKGYSDEWINQRLMSIRVRNALTEEWQKSGVRQGQEYAILTDEITKAWSGMNTRQYKRLKGLKKENLRDNMSDMELILNMLAESTSTEISKNETPSSFEESRLIANRGGKAAFEARKAVEQQTGKTVITSQNATQLNSVVTDTIDSVSAVVKEKNKSHHR